jgi:hypothetical protein
MRQATARKRITKPRDSLKELMVEGIIPLKKNGQRDWSFLTDEKLVQFTIRYMIENGIGRRGELHKTESGLYKALKRRGLLDQVSFEEKRRSWEMNDAEIIEHAKRFMKENGIFGRKELKSADQGLYRILRVRRLLDKVGFEKKQQKSRPWKKMTDDEIIELTRKFMKENGIKGKKELQNADMRTYQALRKRGLLDRIGFEERKPKQRSWIKMTDDEIIELARKFMKENGINGKNDLEKADKGLCKILMRRGLIDRIQFKEQQRKSRPWNKMKNEEIIEYARIFMNENRINTRKELSTMDSGLYNILRKRRLLQRIRFEKKRSIRKWKALSDEQVILIAKRLIKKKGISSKQGLERADKGLHHVLTNRGLLNKVGLEEKITRKRRLWKQMEDKKIIEYAIRYLKEKEIKQRMELKNADPGLYKVLLKRNLLNLVFSDIEKSKQHQLQAGLQQAADAMEQFGDNP